MNYLISSDNLPALQALKKTYASKIDLIYIDPPYNIGLQGRYNDSFKSHSLWIEFMSSRLKAAKELMADHCIIFISIDDGEYAYLKILCDEIFGESNFVSN